MKKLYFKFFSPSKLVSDNLDSISSNIKMIDIIRTKIINTYTIITMAVFILMAILCIISGQLNRLKDLLAVTLAFPGLLLFFLYKNQLKKARITLIISSFIVILFVYYQRITEDIDSHVEINVIQLCLIAHLLFDRLASWLLIILYIVTFILLRILTIYLLHTPFDPDDIIHELLSILIVSYSSYAAKQYVLKIQEILNSQKESLRLQTYKLENANLFKDKVFNIISHDLRGPIATVKMLLINLSDHQKDNPEIKHAIYYVDNVFLNLDNLLHWSRLQQSGWKVYFTDTNINDIISTIIDNFNYELKIKNINIIVEPVIKRIYSDEYLLEIVIRNIVQNAIKFSYSGGVININNKFQDGELKLSIQDFGMGMSVETLTDLSKGVFMSHKGTSGEKGTGLGLEICFELVKLLNGYLTFESTLSVGTKITICLPVPENHTILLS